jgi:hypothetical protein
MASIDSKFSSIEAMNNDDEEASVYIIVVFLFIININASASDTQDEYHFPKLKLRTYKSCALNSLFFFLFLFAGN